MWPSVRPMLRRSMATEALCDLSTVVSHSPRLSGPSSSSSIVISFFIFYFPSFSFFTLLFPSARSRLVCVLTFHCVNYSRKKVVPRLPTLLKRLPSTRSIYLSATRWKQNRTRSRSDTSLSSPPSFATHKVGVDMVPAKSAMEVIGPSLRSVPSVRSGGPGSGWASKTIHVSCPRALAPI